MQVLRFHVGALFVAATALLAASAAAAGSATSPEVSDETGDVHVSTALPAPGQPDSSGIGDVVDIVASWFENETATSIDLHMQVADLSGLEDLRSNPEAFIRLGTRWESDFVQPASEEYWGKTWVASIYATGDAEWTGIVEPPEQDSIGFPVMVDVEGDQFVATLSKEALGNPVPGHRLLNITSLHDMGFPTTAVSWVDQAPDGESTASYVFTVGATPTPGPAPPPAAPPAPPSATPPPPSPVKPVPSPTSALPASPTPPEPSPSPTPEGKGSPLPLPLVVAALAVVAWRRR